MSLFEKQTYFWSTPFQSSSKISVGVGSVLSGKMASQEISVNILTIDAVILLQVIVIKISETETESETQFNEL